MAGWDDDDLDEWDMDEEDMDEQFDYINNFYPCEVEEEDEYDEEDYYWNNSDY